MMHVGRAEEAQQEVEIKFRDDSDEDECSKMWTSCKHTKCCRTAGTRCYEKDGGWAQCKPACVPGPDPVDSNNGSWSCKPLGPQKPGQFADSWGMPKSWVQEQCSAPGESCLVSRCCKKPGQQCFTKDENTAECKNLCIRGTDPTDPNETDHFWECKALGGRTPGAPDWSHYTMADWVSESCSKENENCMDSGCCTSPGLQCYKRDDKYAGCMRSCHPGPQVTDSTPKHWNCTPLGLRTPGRVPPSGNIWPIVEKHKWVEKCGESANKQNNYTGTNCIHSKCCKEGGMQCYGMNEKYGQCMISCTAYERLGPNKPLDERPHKPWACTKHGSRTPRKWGTPSLFCFSVFRLISYEGAIIKNQLSKGIGIFACEVFSIYEQNAEVYVGDGPDGAMSTTHFDFAPVGVSSDGTAGNTGLFMNAWESVRTEGKYKLADWTIKTDPDAVLLPDRMRVHVQKIPQGFYLQNCPLYSESPLFGAIEALSRKALQKYYDNEGLCRSMPWGGWGEDKWLTKCLSGEGAMAQMDAGEVGDARCLGQNCGDGKPAYHPLKDVAQWMNCWYAAGR